MATASVTYTFVNDTPAEAAEVNQNFDDLVDFVNDNTIHTDGSKSMAAGLAMGSNKITGLGTPTANTDAATKLYVDTATSAKAYVDGLLDPTYTTVSSFSTGWATAGISGILTVRYAKYGNLVHVVGAFQRTGASGNTISTVFTLPAGYRPSAWVYVPLVGLSDADSVSGSNITAQITSAGTVRVLNYTSGDDYFFNSMFPAA